MQAQVDMRTPSGDRAESAGLAGAVEQRLHAWVAEVLGDVAIRSSAPRRVDDADMGARIVNVYLMALGPLAESRAARTPPLQFCARYLVTASSADDLFELVFAALARPDYEVDMAPLDASCWLAFDAAPRPAFSIRVALRLARERRPAPMVRAPLVLAPASMVTLQGHLTGPGDIGIAAARVELAGLGMATSSDSSGRFRFVAVPSDAALRVRVQARGSTSDFEVGRAGDLANGLRLHMDFA